MRPKRRILLLDPNEDRRGEFAFVLRCWGYRVIDKAKRGIELVVVRGVPGTQCKLLKDKCDCPLLVIDPQNYAQGRYANITVAKAVSRCEIRGYIQTLSARRRGPKPMKYRKAA